MENKSVQYGQYVVPSPKEIVNFGVGQPSNKMLPLDLIKEGMKSLYDVQDPAILQYGDIPGYFEFRKTLGQYLSKKYNENVTPNELFVTNGITGGLSLICSLLTDNNTVIYVEEPTYFLAINIFKDFGLNVETIPMEDDGINLKILEDKLSNNNINSLLYTIPTFHNPTSITMSHEKRIKLGKLVNKYNKLIVVADEVYQLLYFNAIGPKPLYYYNNNIISLGSFSKILAPSLRLGWIQTSKKWIEILSDSGQLDSSGGINPFISAIVHPLIGDMSLDKNIEKCREFLKVRCNIMCDLVDKYLSKYVEYKRPEGGYFVWLKLKNSSINTGNIMTLALSLKVKFHPGYKFAQGSSCSNYIRLSYSYYDPDGIELGIMRLEKMFKRIETMPIIVDDIQDLESEYFIEKDCINKKNVSILGYKGRLGSRIIDLLQNNNEIEFYSGIDHTMNINMKTNVIVDVSSPEGTEQLITKLLDIKYYIPLIIGTTGILPNILIDRYSKFAPIAVISNFSVGIPQLLKFVKDINIDTWNISMEEIHHIHKKDKPSGTAKTIINTSPLNNIKIPINSIRSEEIIGQHNLILENEYETLEIKHTAKSRDLFAIGAIRYINWIINKMPKVYYEMENGNIIKNENIEFENIEFEKYSGCGNDFIMIDNTKYNFQLNDKIKIIKNICERGSAIGADGVIFLSNHPKYDIKWDFYNKDGSLVPMCGNGAICVIKWLFDHNRYNNFAIIINSFDVATYGDINMKEHTVRIKMPKIEVIKNKIKKNKRESKIGSYNIGVPHVVYYLYDVNINNYDLKSLGQFVRQYEEINVNVIQLNKNNEYRIRTWEKGVWNETLSCGTGCCVAAYSLWDKTTPKVFKMRVQSNDILKVYCSINEIYLEGQANQVFTGKSTNITSNYQ